MEVAPESIAQPANDPLRRGPLFHTVEVEGDLLVGMRASQSGENRVPKSQREYRLKARFSCTFRFPGLSQERLGSQSTSKRARPFDMERALIVFANHASARGEKRPSNGLQVRKRNKYGKFQENAFRLLVESPSRRHAQALRNRIHYFQRAPVKTRVECGDRDSPTNALENQLLHPTRRNKPTPARRRRKDTGVVTDNETRSTPTRQPNGVFRQVDRNDRAASPPSRVTRKKADVIPLLGGTGRNSILQSRQQVRERDHQEGQRLALLGDRLKNYGVDGIIAGQDTTSRGNPLLAPGVARFRAMSQGQKPFFSSEFGRLR